MTNEPKSGEDLLDMSIRDFLEEYCILFSPECMWYYGITTFADAEQMLDDYPDVSECPSMSVTSILDLECSFEDLPVLDFPAIERILIDHLGFSKKLEVAE